VELEFMAVLARKQLGALREHRPEDAEVCSDMAGLFLRDHLGCWGPAFGRRAAAVSSGAWYRSLGRLLTTWLDFDMAATGMVPVEVVEDPLPQEPPDDGMCGPCPVPRGAAT
jgi:TorA maturation chaperone TorD